MKRIYKYNLNVGENKLSLPKGYNLLSVAEQFENIVLYALVHPYETDTELIEVTIVGTGWDLEDDFCNNNSYWHTVKQLDGRLMWHVFLGLE